MTGDRMCDGLAEELPSERLLVRRRPSCTEFRRDPPRPFRGVGRVRSLPSSPMEKILHGLLGLAEVVEPPGPGPRRGGAEGVGEPGGEVADISEVVLKKFWWIRGSGDKRFAHSFASPTQSWTSSLGTHSNPRTFAVTMTRSSDNACAAISRSLLPIGVPAASNSVRMRS